MRNCVRVLTLLIGAGFVLVETDRYAQAQTPSLGALAAAAEAKSSRPTEQQWIVAEVVARMTSIVSPDGTAAVVRVTQPPAAVAQATFTVTLPNGAPMRIEVVDHLWAPGTFAGVAAQLLGSQASAASPVSMDVNARSALTDLTIDTLLSENERISTLLDQNMRNPDAHEAAALLIGAFALQEPWWLGDVRPSLSRMTAHLAMAQVLRAGRAEARDGTLARAILTALVGRQRDAIAIVSAFEPQSASTADRRWVRALRLRITGDWRGTPPSASDSVLERMEHGRAVRERLGMDAFLAYLDTLPEEARGVDWHRLAFTNDGWNTEAGHRFTPENVAYEAVESAHIWSRLHAGRPIEQMEIADLNARPASALKSEGKVQILDWGSWAAQQQRHLAKTLIATASHAFNMGQSASDVIKTYDKTFSGLWLYPVVLRWTARGAEDYERAVRLARPIVEQTPELVVPAAWTFLLEKPAFATRPMPLPLDTPWFTPHVPAGTALELGWRSLRKNNQRPPTRAEITRWAQDMPYDHYTLWSKEWLLVDGSPTLKAVRTALAPLVGYDVNALLKIIMYMPLTDADRIEVSQGLCSLAVGECNFLGEALLMVNREKEAAAAYDKWEGGARDRVAVSQEVTWLIRYHQARGDKSRAEAIARGAGETGSARGLQELAEWLDRAGRYDEAEQAYRRIVDRYEDTVPLGTFLMRQSRRRSDPALQEEASQLLQRIYPAGLEPLAKHNLEPVAAIGVTFHTFGPRAAAAGLQRTDIIVAVDGWRVRDTAQYLAATRFSHDDLMKLLVWRDGRYQDLSVRVPERSMGTRFKEYRR